VKYLLLAGIVFGFTAAPAAVIGQWPGMQNARSHPIAVAWRLQAVFPNRCRVILADRFHGLRPSQLDQTLWLGSMLLLAAAGSVAQREYAVSSSSSDRFPLASSCSCGGHGARCDVVSSRGHNHALPTASRCNHGDRI
jgi:hypothetical protein